MEAVATKTKVTEGKFLTFILGSEVYGIEILKVREIIKLMDITTVPKTPDYLKGVINLRGKVIPIVDLRSKFTMPEMDGYEATCTIRDETSSVRNHSIPIIAMTANAMKGDREKCIEAGMDDYVTKPINMQKLADAIERNLCDEDKQQAQSVSIVSRS